jgi:hypothetical protein
VWCTMIFVAGIAFCIGVIVGVVLGLAFMED